MNKFPGIVTFAFVVLCLLYVSWYRDVCIFVVLSLMLNECVRSELIVMTIKNLVSIIAVKQ